MKINYYILKLCFCEYYYPGLALRSLQTEESSRQPELLNFFRRIEIWIVHREGQIKFPEQDGSRRILSVTHRRRAAQENHSLLVCVPGIFKNPSEMEQFEKATGDVGIWAKEG